MKPSYLETGRETLIINVPIYPFPGDPQSIVETPTSYTNPLTIPVLVINEELAQSFNDVDTDTPLRLDITKTTEEFAEESITLIPDSPVLSDPALAQKFGRMCFSMVVTPIFAQNWETTRWAIATEGEGSLANYLAKKITNHYTTTNWPYHSVDPTLMYANARFFAKTHGGTLTVQMTEITGLLGTPDFYTGGGTINFGANFIMPSALEEIDGRLKFKDVLSKRDFAYMRLSNVSQRTDPTDLTKITYHCTITKGFNNVVLSRYEGQYLDELWGYNDGTTFTPASSYEVAVAPLPSDDTSYDPFSPGGGGELPGDAGDGSVDGGDGTFNWDDDADDIEFNNLPSVSAVNTGFVTLLNPTESQLRDLASFLWSDLFSLDTLKKIFADPMELILGLNIVPVDVPQGSLMRLKVAGFSTGLSIYRAASQYVTVDCGSVNLQEYWGAYLDYAPYTKVSLYLPYIGVVPLNTDDVMHRTISIKYKVDILTGACMAQVKCSGGKHCNINSVMYHYTGNCAINVPVSSSNFAQTISALIGVATTAVGLYTGGSATAAAITAGQATQAVGEAGLQVADAMLPATPLAYAKQDQAYASAEATIARGDLQIASAQASRASAVERAIGSTASYVMNAKPTINRAGSISGTSGIFGVQIPYLIVEAPRQSLAANYNAFVGYPSNINEPLNTLSGFTSFEKIFLQGIPATDPELAELYSILKNGVIF